MSGTSSAYDAGYAVGQRLLAPRTALDAIVAQETVRLRQEEAALGSFCHLASIESTSARHRLEDVEQKAEERRSAQRLLEEARTLSPARFSLGRGLLYLLAGALVLLADAVFLTQVLASILQLDVAVLGPDGTTIGPVGALLDGRREYVAPFYELYFSSLGVVAFALVFKAWLDWRKRLPAAPQSERSPWAGLPAYAVMVLVVITFAYLAYTRLVLDFGEFTNADGDAREKAARFAAALIGLAGPAAGTFLFIVGMDLLSSWLRLVMQRVDTRYWEKKEEVAREEVQRAERRYAEASCRQAEAVVPLRIGAARSQLSLEFRQGYAAGLEHTLDESRPGAYKRVRQLLVATTSLTMPAPSKQTLLLPPGS